MSIRMDFFKYDVTETFNVAVLDPVIVVQIGMIERGQIRCTLCGTKLTVRNAGLLGYFLAEDQSRAPSILVTACRCCVARLGFNEAYLAVANKTAREVLSGRGELHTGYYQ